MNTPDDAEIVAELRSLWVERCSGDNKHPAVIVLDGDRFRRWFGDPAPGGRTTSPLQGDS